MSVMAQQMQIESDKGQSEFTFRKWNPSQERVMWGSDNDSSLEPVCPMTFLCCFLTEIICFRLLFKETIDHCGSGYKSVQQIISEYHRSQNVLGQTNLLRLIVFLLTIGGCYLIVSPFYARILWIPEAGYLLEHQFMASAIIYAAHCATALYLIMVALTWIPYRCCVSFFMLAICGSLIGVMVLGTPLTMNQALQIYQ